MREGKVLVQKSPGRESRVEVILPEEVIPIHASRGKETFHYKAGLKNLTLKLHISGDDWQRHLNNTEGGAGMRRPFEKLSTGVVGFTMAEYALKCIRFARDFKKNPELALRGLHENIVDKKLMELQIQKIHYLVSKIAEELRIEENVGFKGNQGTGDHKGAGGKGGNAGKNGGEQGKNEGTNGNNGKNKKNEGKNENADENEEGGSGSEDET